MSHARISHDQLTDYLDALGYGEEDVPGVCSGTALMALFAFLNKDIKRYLDSFKIIANTPHLIEKIKFIQQSLSDNCYQSTRPQVKFSPGELHDLIQVMALFDGIILFQDPNLYQEIFIDYITGNKFEKILPLIGSDAIEKNSGIVTVTAWPGIYTQAEFKDYLQSLDDVAHRYNEDIALSLTSTDHLACVCYDRASQQWMLFDANYLPIEIFSAPLSAATPTFLEVFFSRPNRKIGLNTTVYSLEKNKAITEALIQDLHESTLFKTVHAITPAKAAYQTPNGFKLIHMAALLGHEETIDALSAMNADLNEKTLDDRTPAILATKRGHTHLIQKLTEFNIDFNLLCNGDTVAYLAALVENPNILKILARAGMKKHHDAGFYLTQPTLTHRTPFMTAVILGHTSIISAFAQIGLQYHDDALAYMAHTFIGGKNPLHIAAYNGYIDMVELLVHHGMDLNQKNHKGQTPAHVAIRKHQHDTLATLLSLRMDIYHHAYDDLAVVAARYGNLTALKALILQGFDVSKPDKKDATPLFVAKFYKQNNIIYFLQSFLYKKDFVNRLTEQLKFSLQQKMISRTTYLAFKKNLHQILDRDKEHYFERAETLTELKALSQQINCFKSQHQFSKLLRFFSRQEKKYGDDSVLNLIFR